MTCHLGLFADVIRDRKTGVKYTQGTRIACERELLYNRAALSKGPQRERKKRYSRFSG